MISSLFFLNVTGEVIIDFQFREKVPRTTLDSYWSSVITPLQSLEEAPTLTYYNNLCFYQIQHNRVFVVATTTEDGSALMVLEVLALVVRLMQDYLKDFSEDTIRENFAMVYQLLMEVLDFGYPLTTEAFYLERLVAKPTLKNKVRTLLDTVPVSGSAGPHGVVAMASSPTSTSPSLAIGHRQQILGYRGAGVPWRDPSTCHNHNEILFDVVELLDYTMDSDGRLLKASVRGTVEVNCRLSGMPELLVRLADTHVMEDTGFHRCVRQGQYHNDKSLSFIPPDGRFTLMQYTCVSNTSLGPPPFYVTPQVSFNHRCGRFNCMVGLRGSASSNGYREVVQPSVQSLRIEMMLPPNTASLTVSTCTAGTTSFDRHSGVLTWSLPTVTRDSPSLSGDFAFPSNSGESSPVAKATTAVGAGATAVVSFRIPNYSVSGIRIDAVQILNEVGKPYKGVKYVTQSGDFIVRAV